MATTIKVLVPTVHLNGTSKQELLNQAEDARDAVEVAISLLQAAAPNARDYYPQSGRAFEQARRQHQDRLSRLQTVSAELIEIYNSIEDQGG